MKFKIKYIIILFIILTIFIAPFSYGASESINLYSKGAILIEQNSGQILYEKNANEKLYPASTTKILTAIIALEKCNLEDIVTVKQSAVSAVPSGYSSAYLSAGEEINVRDLVTVFLVHSANDAGFVLAEHISGSVEKFADLMNEKAKEIGCKNSNFLNPSGIHNNNHYSTAYDLSLIAKYCMENKTFSEIVAMDKCTISATNKFGIRTYSNTNDLLNKNSKYKLNGCFGIKTGYTKEAQNCLISGCTKDGLNLISVVLGAGTTEKGESERYVDSHILYDYGFSNFKIKNIASKGNTISTIEIKNGSKDTRNLDLILQNDIKAIVNINDKNPEPEIKLNDIISAPISENTVLGKVTYKINDIEYSENIVASHNVETNDFILVTFEISLGLIILLTIITILIKKNKKSKKRKKKYTTKY